MNLHTDQSARSHSGWESPILASRNAEAEFRALVDTVAAPLSEAAKRSGGTMTARYLLGSVGVVDNTTLSQLVARSKASNAAVAVDPWIEQPGLFQVVLGSDRAFVLNLGNPEGRIPLTVETDGAPRPLRYLVVSSSPEAAPRAVFDLDTQTFYGPSEIAQAIPKGWNVTEKPIEALNSRRG